MARNKYPEITIGRILDVSLKLFLEKGYDQTTIQDIVDALEDLSKGAVYHHFKGKEEILNAVMDRLYLDFDPFSKVTQIKGISGLEMLRKLLLFTTEETPQVHMQLYRGAKSLLKNPQFLARQIEEIVTVDAPMLAKVVSIGIEDGSIQTMYPEEASEAVLILLNIWLSPNMFSVDETHFMKKLDFLGDMMEKIGVPVLDQQGKESFRRYYLSLNQKEAENGSK